MLIGVLALQGAFQEHISMLRKLHVDAKEIRNKQDLEENSFDGFILPGGESTTIGRLLHELDLHNGLKQKISSGVPVFGTCAGMILLAKKITSYDNVHLATMDIEVVRNGYGRQLGSFTTKGSVCDLPGFPMVFIRAPYIKQVKEDATVLAIVNNRIVAVKQDNMLVCSFHPELTSDLRMHDYFIKMVTGVISQ